MRSASCAAYASRMRSADWEMNPRPRHSKYGRSSNTSDIAFSATLLPSYGTTRWYWFSTSQRPSAICSRIILIDWSTSSGSKPETTSGLP